ncbi:MAG: thioredoxin family protein [Bacteroidetes bacterium]|nr:thioredoxin family protein [Bacteroidota bacterium]
MKFLQIFFISIFWAALQLPAHAQFGEESLNPVEWTFESGKKVGDRYELRFKATIEEGWHLYSHFIEDGGPIPTSFYFDDNEAVEIKDKLSEEGKKVTMHDEAFDMELSWFSNEVTFVQKVKLKNGFDGAVIKGELEFMVCDEEKCLPPDLIPFVFTIGKTEQPEKTEMIDEGFVMIEVDSLTADTSNEPTRWFYRVTEQDDYLKVEWKVLLGKDWQIYSQHITEGGPLPTVFIYDERGNFSLEGKVIEEGQLIKKKEPLFDNMELLSYKDEVIFAQLLKWIDDRDPILSGAIEYMICDIEACLFAGIDFKVDLSQRGEWIAMTTETPDTLSDSGKLFHWDKLSDCNGKVGSSEEKSKGNWLIFLLGFGGGLFALLTPCVFPMIPLTVSFFTKKDQKRSIGIRNAFIYGISIIVLYVALSLIITAIFGADAMNRMATSPIVNTIFFVLFVIFAISFFGYFEITLPSSWTNKADQAASKGGITGIIFMAFTLALVSFSCTGPIIGSLLVEAATGEGATILGRIPVRPLIGMFGFGLALALPFTLFALFPSWLNSLPQSGGWLNTVKVFLGFIELALAFKFLSVADMTGNWGILKIEPFLIIWILIFAGLAAYLLGLIRFPHDSKVNNISWPRKLLGLASFAFVIYLATGLGNPNPRKLLSGLAPPAHYSFFNHKDCPAGLSNCFHDFEEGMKYAQKNKMPVLIDFTGYGCVNCRKMEENVWTDPKVKAAIEKFVLISLYVDDTKKLPESETYFSTATGKNKKIRTVGNKWHDFQIVNFKKVSQPYYVLVSPNNYILNEPVAYTPNSEEYLHFLQCGLDYLEVVCPECR